LCDSLGDRDESHDITFSRDGARAYVAALSHAEILDTTDPAKPRSIATLIDPSVNVWHEAEAIHLKDPVYGEGDFLIAEDEFAGAEGTAQCPNGGVHVYDITGDKETHPVPVGAFNIDQAGVAPGNDPADAYVARCTAHVFRSTPVEADDDGLVQRGRPRHRSPCAGRRRGGQHRGRRHAADRLVPLPRLDTWAAKAVHASRKGYYFFGNDKRRGFDVYASRHRPRRRRPACG